MELHDLLGKLDGVKAQGGYHIARCPCPAHSHGDREPSLSIREEDGRLHLRCFVSGGDDEVLTALGITWKDLVPEETGRAADDLVTEYRYEDELGHLLYVVERHVGKRFTQRAADGSRSLKGVRRVLYRLPQVRLAIRDRRHVFLVEGEKDVHTLEGLGCVATTNSGGAEGWKSEYGDQLSGAKLVILYDNDEAGFKRATKLQEELRTRTRSLKVVDLPGLPDKGDVTDWVAAGGTKEQLVALVKGTDEAMNAKTILRKVTEAPITLPAWLWYPWLPQGELTIMGGYQGVGKSYLAIAIAASLSHGGSLPLMDNHLKPGATAYLAFEDTETTLRCRMEMMGGDPEQLYTLTLRDAVTGEPSFQEADCPALAESLAGLPQISLVIIDPTLNLFIGGSANLRWEEDVRRVLGRLLGIARTRDISILLLTHLNKGGRDVTSLQRFMGANAFTSVPRSVILCGNDPNDSRKQVMLHDKVNGARKADPLAYRITSEGLMWLDEQPLLSADDILGNKPRAQMPAVDEWLLELLSDNQEHAVRHVEDASRKAGFTWKQVEKSRNRLKERVAHRKEGFGSEAHTVLWRFQ